MRSFLMGVVLAGALPPAGALAGALESLEFGGQFRARGETRNPTANYVAARGEDMLLFRTRFWTRAEPAEGMRAYVQMQHVHTAGSDTPTDTDDDFGLHQGFLDVLDLWGLPLSLRAGRQELKYGDQRLISPLDWSNNGRTWDGVRLRAEQESWRADLFATVVDENRTTRQDDVFSGLYASCRAVPGHEFDLYVLARDEGDGSYFDEQGVRQGNLSQRTAGARLKGKAGGADYSGEAAWQFGRKAGDELRAWALAATAGYTFEAAGSPRVGVEYDLASGDRNPTDARDGTFDPIFPFGHALQGYADLFSWKNGHAIKAGVSAKPGEGWNLQADFHHFRLAQATDGWYSAGGTQLARDTAGASGRTVGNELDLHAKATVRGALKLWFGYSRFFRGNFAKNRGFGKDMDWAFLQAVLDF
ncbi:MAG: alginate export family protein [Elusimicrobiota bacterium]